MARAAEVTFSDIERAASVLRDLIDSTPLTYPHSLSRMFDCEVHLKTTISMHWLQVLRD